ncbi:RNA-directed DNA polymerase, eukaryota [Tanacetum coccineum]
MEFGTRFGMTPEFSGVPLSPPASFSSTTRWSTGPDPSGPSVSLILEAESLKRVNDLCRLRRLHKLVGPHQPLETKMVHVDLWVIRQVWGNTNFDFTSSSSRGRSGGYWIQNGLKVMFVAVYAPQSLAGKTELWSSISRLIRNWDGHIIVMGDFNEVREARERFEKGVPDHRPILLKESVVDYGSTPFRFFHSWLDIECFHDLVVDTWKNYECSETNGMISFKKKLQHLKQVIREWNYSKTLSDNQLRKEHQSRLSFIDVKMDQGTATREDLNCRVSLMKILGDIERKEVSDLAQKSKIKWVIEGDENSSFFHGSLKKKRRQIAIKCVFKNGVWIEEPGKVKEEFYDHFCSRLSYSRGDRPSLRDMSFNQISLEQRESLESDFTNDEIKRAVWDCGGDSAPGPDGFTFKFFKTFWETIQSDVVRFVREFAQTARFPKGCNFAFIALIPKVGNAKFVSEFRPISLIGCQYKIVDDAIFVGEWSQSNAYNLICMLRCFYKVSGLKINVHKSKLLGVNVPDGDVVDMAKVLGCGVSKLPMMYLASKATGGLGIGSIYALNAALLFKWIWRFRCSPNDLWVKVIKDIHGSDGAICRGRLDKSSQSPWNAILRSCTVAQRISSLDWNSVLRRSPRGGVELNQFTAMLEAIRDINLSDSIDGWKWALDSKGFTVSSARKFIDEQTLIGGFTSTRRLRCIPIKVNVFMWRLSLNKLLTLVNMDRKGIDVASLLCPVCSEHVESVDHLFFTCEIARDIWVRLARWCHLVIPDVPNITE